jgi:inner membrane protein
MSDGFRFPPLAGKISLIVVASLALLVVLSRVESLINERSVLRAKAVEHVAASAGRAQQVGVGLVTLPLTRTWDDAGRSVSDTNEFHLLAETVDVVGQVTTATRHSGIYAVPTYLATLHVTGSVRTAPLRKLLASEPGVVKRAGPLTLFVALSDPAGVRVLDAIRIGGKPLSVAPMIANGLKGVGVEIGILDELPESLDFAFDLQVSGTEQLQFLPFAATTHVALKSSWSSPSFNGAFGPDNAPTVTPQGFAADWRVLQLNRDYPQQWQNGAVGAPQISASAFGVAFYQPVDAYQRNYRASHYAFLFIALTFMVMFLLENTTGFALHPVQYAMTGAALAIFFLVLLALSEHLGFAGAYGLAAGSLSVLLAIYYSGITRSARTGIVIGGIAGVCYGLLYLLILSEENALLFGSLSLFAALAAIMIATRKIDWYRLRAAP